MDTTDVDPRVRETAMGERPQRAMPVAQLAEAAARRIAPLWPLTHFVAVNPWVGLLDRPFDDVADLMSRTAGARMTRPRSDYAAAIERGDIADADIDRARSLVDAPFDTHAVHAALYEAPPSMADPLPTVTDLAGQRDGRDYSRLAAERITTFAADHFDAGQLTWRSTVTSAGTYGAWRAQARIDRTPEITGLKDFRRAVKSLPEQASDTLERVGAQLALDDAALETYFHRLLMTIGGWAGHARYRLWQRELEQSSDDALVELLAVRAAWEVVLLERNPDVAATLRDAYAPSSTTSHAATTIDLVLQSAAECAWQRRFLDALANAPKVIESSRPALQAAFCIDVRSEVYRRALESRSSTIETIGFAGFFGFPIEYVPIGQRHGGAHCPVLLTPAFTVCETVHHAEPDESTEVLGLRVMRRRATRAWKAFKTAAVSSFAFVETMGLTYAGKLATDAFGLTRPVPDPSVDGIDPDVRRRLGPSIERREVDGRATGFDADQKIDMAEAVLKAMSMRGGFARLVILVGHGSSTVNNPHATGLDCGACGGHTGEANARVACAILNDATVRDGLPARGIDLPTDTVFVGALHDTTTDEITLFDTDGLPDSHHDDLQRARAWLVDASVATRRERAARLDLDDDAPIESAIFARSRDWSQVRPEWGLAGCAAFVAAPRRMTRGIDLEGRVFLHSYDWSLDDDFAILELIMSAPMVVASWISLQYYGSTVDNDVFGAGNKALHNVVGTFGVLEGNRGDLRVGLPLQSVHDGARFVHEPLRLSVLLVAPHEAIDAVLERQPSVRALLDHRWITLFATPSVDYTPSRRLPDGRWLADD